MGKVYNKDNKIIIYNADCLLMLDSMIRGGMQVDCIATDPPYPTTSRGCAGNSGGMLQKDINKKGQVFNHNSCNVKDWMPKLYKVLKMGGHCYIMTNHKNLIEYLNVATDNGFHFIKSIIWDKQNKIMGQYYMSQFEYVLFFRKGKGIKINNCGTPDILSIPNKKHKDSNGQNYHDTEKPIELMKILIENSTKENEVVLDPFVGIGATPKACDLSSRKFIGAEIDEKNFKVIEDRLDGRFEE